MNNCQCFTYKKNNYIEENGIKEFLLETKSVNILTLLYTINHNLCLKYLF